jgi:hypothetical protein
MNKLKEQSKNPTVNCDTLNHEMCAKCKGTKSYICLMEDKTILKNVIVSHEDPYTKLDSYMRQEDSYWDSGDY